MESDENIITIIPWKLKAIIYTKRLFNIISVATILILLLFLISLILNLSNPLFGIILSFILILEVLTVSIYLYSYYYQAQHEVVYIFDLNKKKIFIVKRIYHIWPVIKFLSGKGSLIKDDHTSSCGKQIFEFQYLVDPGENDDIKEERSHIYNGVLLISRKWTYTINRYVSKIAELKHMSKSDWDFHEQKIYQAIQIERESYRK